MTPHPVAVAVVLGTLALLALGGLLLEGRTVLRCLAGLRGGAGPLRRLRWGFLLSEVWPLATVGLAHAALPSLTHSALAAAWLPVTLFTLGWMLRDWGLWQVVLLGREGLWPRTAGAGALLQLLSGLAAAAFAVPALLTSVRSQELELVPSTAGAGYGVLAVVAPLSVLVVLGVVLALRPRLSGSAGLTVRG